jgi:hypothetical protein
MKRSSTRCTKSKAARKSLRSVAGWGQRANVLPLEKADLAIRDKEYGATPLGWARYAGRQEAVEFLRSLGASD